MSADRKSGSDVALGGEGTMPDPKVKHTVRGGLLLLSGAVVALAFVIYSGIHSRVSASYVLRAETAQAAIRDVTVIHPKAASPTDEVILPGSAQPYIYSPVYARASGYLVNWFHDIGSRVKQGDLLAVIDTPELNQQLSQGQADLENAKANAALAKITADRWLGLEQERSVSRESVDQAVSNLNALQATVNSFVANAHRLETLVAYEKVYAPFDGVITVRNTDVGWLIDAGANAPGKELFQIAQTSTLRVFVAIPEVYSRAARLGATAAVTLDEFPNRTFKGKVVRTADAIDMASRTLNTEVDVDNPTGELLPGAYTQVHLKLSNVDPAVIVPSNALLFRSEGLRVGIIRSGRAQLAPVTIGVDYGDTVQVISGLTTGDDVIVNPADSLISGEQVRITRPPVGAIQ